MAEICQQCRQFVEMWIVLYTVRNFYRNEAIYSIPIKSEEVFAAAPNC